MFVKPTPLQPDDPDADPIPRVVRFERSTMILPQTGGEVPDTPYWWRRISQGDVEETDPPRKRSHKRTKPDEEHVEADGDAQAAASEKMPKPEAAIEEKS
jgi:Protein of unknown function (DUF2635)